MVLYFPHQLSARKAPMTGMMKVVPFQVSTWAALKAVGPWSTVPR